VDNDDFLETPEAAAARDAYTARLAETARLRVAREAQLAAEGLTAEQIAAAQTRQAAFEKWQADAVAKTEAKEAEKAAAAEKAREERIAAYELTLSPADLKAFREAEHASRVERFRRELDPDRVLAEAAARAGVPWSEARDAALQREAASREASA